MLTRCVGVGVVITGKLQNEVKRRSCFSLREPEMSASVGLVFCTGQFSKKESSDILPRMA